MLSADGESGLLNPLQKPRLRVALVGHAPRSSVCVCPWRRPEKFSAANSARLRVVVEATKLHASALGIDEDVIGFVADEPAINRVNDL